MEAENYLKENPTDGISCLKYANMSDDLLASSWDSTLYLYDGYSNALRQKYRKEAPILCTDFTADERGAYLAGLENKVQRIDFETDSEIDIGFHDEPVRALQYDNLSQCLYTGSWDKTLKIWDERSGNKETVHELSDKVYGLSVTRNKVVIAMANNRVVIYDTRGSKEIITEDDTGVGKYQIRCCRAMPSGDGYALGSVEGRIAIEYFAEKIGGDIGNFTYKCHRLTKEQNGEKFSYIYPVNDISFHSGYGTYASCGSDGMVKIWDPYSRKKLWKKEFENGLSTICFNKDGSKLACGLSYNYDTEEIPMQVP